MTALTEKQSHDFCQKALEKKKHIEIEFVELGGMLYRIQKDRLYEAGWDSWEEYCMEFKLDKATVSKLQRIYTVLVLGYKIEPLQLASAGGWSNVAEILPFIKEGETTKERVRELLNIVVDQTRKHARTTLKEIKRGSPCKHTKTRFLLLEICDDNCNERWNVTDNYEIKPR